MGLIANFKESMARAREERLILEQERELRLKPYYRGYDVFPDEIRDEYASPLKKRLLRNVVIKWFIVAALLFGMVYLLIISGGNAAVFCVFIGVAAFALICFAVSDLSYFLRVRSGIYDVFGGMVTDTRIEEETTTDSDGNTSTSYTYFVTLNGIECEVPRKEYNKVKVETYCIFVRLPAKYIKNDKFVLFPCSPSEQDKRIGQHYPSHEMRLYRPPSSSILAILTIVMSLLGALVFAVLTPEKMDGNPFFEYHYLFSAGLIGVAAAAFFGNRASVNKRAEQELEEKRRRYDRE